MAHNNVTFLIPGDPGTGGRLLSAHIAYGTLDGKKLGGPVAKTTASAEQIQTAMQEWIRTSNELDGGCRRCEAPLPMPLASPRGGANWTAGYVKAMPGCQQFMDRIVERAKREFDLERPS